MKKIYKVIIAVIALAIASMMVVDIAHAESYIEEATRNFNTWNQIIGRPETEEIVESGSTITDGYIKEASENFKKWDELVRENAKTGNELATTEETATVTFDTIICGEDDYGILSVDCYTYPDGKVDYEINYYYSDAEHLGFCEPDNLKDVMIRFHHYWNLLSNDQTRDDTLMELRNKAKYVYLIDNDGRIEYIIDER